MAEGIKQRCDFCNEPALYDGKTKLGPWAFMCEAHMDQLGIRTPGLFSVLEDAVPKKRCAICGAVKPVTDFYQYVDHSGVKRYRNECKACNLSRRKKVQK